MVAQINVAVGPDSTVDDARAALDSYYGFLGDTSGVTDNLFTTPRRIRDAITALADLGADEVMLYCWARDSEQIDRFADIVA